MKRRQFDDYDPADWEEDNQRRQKKRRDDKRRRRENTSEYSRYQAPSPYHEEDEY